MAEWGKLYGSLHGSPKWRRAPKGARALWTTANSWCIDQEAADGAIPRDMLRHLDGTVSEAAALVAVGLWDATDDGWRFHDWHQRQRTAEQIKRDREAAAERQRRARAKRDGHAVTPTDGHTVSHGVSHGAREEQRRTEERTKDSPSPAAPPTPHPTPTPHGFDQFWEQYPRKVGKQAARKAYATATRTVTPAKLLLAARRYAADPNLPDKQFIPHPSTWLNEGRWDDEPLPPRTTGRPGEAPAPGTSLWDRQFTKEPA